MTHIPTKSNHHPRNPLLVVISGPSGVGKDTVLQRMQECNRPFHFVVTTTSRPPRPGETEGVDYHFVSVKEFERMIAADELLEYAIVYDQYKGIPKKQVREAFASGQDVVMRIDVQGAATIRSLAPEAVLIFLTTSDEAELLKRLNARKTESEEGLAVRIQTAQAEYQRIKEFDYEIINRENQLEETVDTVFAIIHTEHHRTKPRQVDL